MLLPIGDTPNPTRFRPYVNWTLIAANVLVYVFITLPLTFTSVDPSDPQVAEYLRFLLSEHGSRHSVQEILASLSAYDLFVLDRGYRPSSPSVADLFTSMFLHGGFAHLAGNMLFLYIFGDNCEHRLGRWKYLVTYLATGILATLSFAFLSGPSGTPLVGASGAISGVLGFYFLQFPRNRVKVFVALFPFYLDVILLPCRWVLGFYVVAQNLIPLLFGSESNVAYGAHLGGFFAGLGIAYIGERFSWGAPWVDRGYRPSMFGAKLRTAPPPQAEHTTKQPVGPPDSPLDALRQALSDRDQARALALLSRLRGRDILHLSTSEIGQLATWLRENGHLIAAGDLLRRAIGASSAPPRELAPLYLEIALVRLQQGQATSAYQYLLMTLEMDPDPSTEAAARRALATIDVYQRHGRKTPNGRSGT